MRRGFPRLLTVMIIGLLIALASSGQTAGTISSVLAAGKCAATEGTDAASCAIATKAVVDYLRTTTEVKAWEIGTACNGGDISKKAHDAFIEIRHRAKNWGNEPGNANRIKDLAEHTGSDRTMCMLNAIVGKDNCNAFLVAARDSSGGKSDPTKGWRAKFCK